MEKGHRGVETAVFSSRTWAALAVVSRAFLQMQD